MPLVPIALVVGALIGITIQKTVDQFKKFESKEKDKWD